MYKINVNFSTAKDKQPAKKSGKETESDTKKKSSSAVSKKEDAKKTPKKGQSSAKKEEEKKKNSATPKGKSPKKQNKHDKSASDKKDKEISKDCEKPGEEAAGDKPDPTPPSEVAAPSPSEAAPSQSEIESKEKCEEAASAGSDKKATPPSLDVASPQTQSIPRGNSEASKSQPQTVQESKKPEIKVDLFYQSTSSSKSNCMFAGLVLHILSLFTN